MSDQPAIETGRAPSAAPCTRTTRSRIVAAAGKVKDWAVAHRKLVTAAGTLLTLAALATVLAGRWGAFADAAVGASPWLLAAAVALHVGSLLARSEAWYRSVGAAGGTVSRRRLYRAASVGFVGNIINGELGFALRIASLRRSAPTEVPKILTIAATEVPLVVVEVSLATLASFTLVEPLGLGWWAPFAAFALVAAAFFGLRRLVRRKPAGWRHGLSILGDARACSRMAVFVALAVCGQVLRNWLMLHASGVHASLGEATALLIAVAVLGTLPVGPSSGAAAAVMILGAHGVVGTSAAGILLTATASAGALAYGGWAYVDRRLCRRAQARASAGEPRRQTIVAGAAAEANAP